MRMSAAMSFYGILSLAPLLLAIVGVLGWWLDREVLEKGLLSQLSMIIGDRGASVLADTLASAKKPAQGITASVAGFLVLLFGATGVFNELQAAFEQVWSYPRQPEPRAGLRHAAALRLRGIGYILVFGFLLLVSLVVSTLLSLFSGWAGNLLPLELALRVLNEVIAFAICAALFAGLMRLSGGARPRRRFLLGGACLGAILFTIGRQALAAYLAGAAVVSAYGAAGSLIVLLMWIYFSSAVLLFGAGCARALQEQAEQKTLTNQGAALGEDERAGGEQADGQQDQQSPAVAGGTRPHHA
jgi:membrane protein